MLFITTVIIGIVSFINLPIELTPQTEYPKISVTTTWNNVSPEVIEAFLTSPLEATLTTVKGIKKISSRSSEGISYIDIEFHPSTDINLAKLEINEKLGSLTEELPYGVSPPKIIPYIPKEFRDLQGFLTYTLSSNLSANEIRKYALGYLKAPLLSIDGVSNVEVKGGNQREILITIDFQKTKIYNITIDGIITAINNAQQIISAGSIKNNYAQISVKISNTFTNADFLLNQPIKIIGNTIIRLKDIGSVIDDFSEPTSYYRINGKEAVFIEISKEPGKNSIKVADEVFKKLNELEKEFPPGFNLSKEIDLSENIRKEINELIKAAILSFFIIVLVLIIFFRKIVYSIIVISSIIFSLLSAAIFFYVFDLPLNILTIASLILGLGMMVDNSIVVIDYLERNITYYNVKRIAVLIKNIFFPVFASSLTTIAVFIPLVFFTGELKIYLEQFALAVVVTLVSSLFISFTVTPMLFSKTLKKEKHSAENTNSNSYSLRNKDLYPKQTLFESFYSFALQKIFKWKKLSFTLLILTIGLPVWLLPSQIETPVLSIPYNTIFSSEKYQQAKKYINFAFGGSLNLFFNHIQRGEVFAYGDANYLIVSLKLPNGNRIDRLNKLVKSFETEILIYKDKIESVTSNVYDEQNAVIQINFPKGQFTTAFPYQLKNYLTAYAVTLGGLDVGVYGFGPGFFSGSGGSMVSFVIELRGFNYNKLIELANELKSIIIKNPRIDNVDIDRSFYSFSDDNVYEIYAKFDRDLLARNNITIKELTDAISKSTSGNLTYSKFTLAHEEVFYTIKFDNYKNIQQDELENFILNKKGKSNLKLKDVINFEENKVLSSIKRENQQYIRYVSFDYKGPFQYGNEFVESSISKIKLPAGYTIKQRPFMFRFDQEEEIQIWAILLLAVILIFMITSALFESLKNPIIIILTIPFSLVGTIVLFYLGDFVMDRGAYAGMLLLIGLSVNNSIILVDYLLKNYNNEGIKQIIKLSYSRLRPIFSTTFTTITALLPLMIDSESSFWKSLSLSVTGGLIFSSLFVILIVPNLFYMINSVEKK